MGKGTYRMVDGFRCEAEPKRAVYKKKKGFDFGGRSGGVHFGLTAKEHWHNRGAGKYGSCTSPLHRIGPMPPQACVALHTRVSKQYHAAPFERTTPPPVAYSPSFSSKV